MHGRSLLSNGIARQRCETDDRGCAQAENVASIHDMSPVDGCKESDFQNRIKLAPQLAQEFYFLILITLSM
jgi:hypothetical protein